MQLSKLVLFAFLVSQSAFAQIKREVLHGKTPIPTFDPIKESNALPIMKEKTVQSDEPESKHVLTASLGAVTAQSLTLASNGAITHYDLSRPTPVFGVGFGYFPARFMGYWGLDTSLGYSYRQQNNDLGPSVLHLFNFDTLLAYRFELSSRSWVKPYLGVGPGSVVAYQRGSVDELNTSESHFVGVAEAGLRFNMNRVLSMDSPLGWELTLQYKRWIEPNATNADFNGQLVTVGFSTLL